MLGSYLKTHLCPFSLVEVGGLVGSLHASGFRVNLRHNRSKVFPFHLAAKYFLITSCYRKANFFLGLFFVSFHFFSFCLHLCLENHFMHWKAIVTFIKFIDLIFWMYESWVCSFHFAFDKASSRIACFLVLIRENLCMVVWFHSFHWSVCCLPHLINLFPLSLDYIIHQT